MERRGLRTLPVLLVSIFGLVRNARRLGSHRRAESDAYLEAGVPPRPPERRVDFWERKGSSCFHLDDICSGNGGWFYGPGRWHRDSHQPTTMLVVDRDDISFSHGFDLEVEERIRFNVSSTSHPVDDDTCSFSPTPYHVVVQSAYSEMMGEFYSRVILGLDRWMSDFPPRSNEDLQMYVHFVDRRKQRLLEGHRLFLGGLPNNNKFDNFLSLMPNDSCRCYTKLIFCGYDVGNVTTIPPNVTMADPEEDATIIKPRAFITNRRTECSMKTDSHALKHGNCTAYRRLRRDLIDTYVEKDPLLNEKIRRYRKRLLLEMGLIGNNTRGVGEWKFVGLARRKYRRKWRNIGEVVSACREKFTRHKVACLTVDVEEARSPEEQLLMHRSLHALVGVHGAQMTQGVLLPGHGHVLELLPWVPHYLWGGWVARTHAPTPLGIIYHGTDVNHVGYPLGRESVPLCTHVDPSEEELDRECLMNETSGALGKFRWAGRDFDAPVEAIEDFVESFLLEGGEDGSICDDMRERAERKNFVLYNAFCRRDANQTGYVAEHFYRERDEDAPRNIHSNERAVRGNA